MTENYSLAVKLQIPDFKSGAMKGPINTSKSLERFVPKYRIYTSFVDKELVYFF